MKLSQESIHVIVLGFSSAIITAENIRGEFKYRTVTLFYLVLNFFYFLCGLCMCIWHETTCITVVTLLSYCILERWRGTICQQISQATCHKGWNHDPIFSQEVTNFFQKKTILLILGMEYVFHCCTVLVTINS